MSIEISVKNGMVDLSKKITERCINMQKSDELRLPKSSKKLDEESIREIYGGRKRIESSIRDWLKKHYPSK